MKTGPDAVGTAENLSERTKYENGTKRPRYNRKLVFAQNMKTGTGALGTAGNESERVKYENRI
jgi:hypothetical protein